jgi:hypothetical protein
VRGRWGIANLAVVRRFAVNLVRTASEPERPRPMKHAGISLRRKIAAWRDDYLAVASGASAR